jgi:alpha-tubulin suppressor-like RCC1 family protein
VGLCLVFLGLAGPMGAAPTITSPPQGGMYPGGSAVSLSVTATGAGALSYQWLKDGVLLPEQTNATLSLTSFQLTQSGNYQTVVSDTNGMAISLPTAALIAGTGLSVWGANESYQAGYQVWGSIGFITDIDSPIPFLDNVITAANGAQHALVVSDSGDLLGLGENRSGQLGLPPFLLQPGGYVTKVPFPSGITNNVVAVAAGEQHSLYLTRDGTLWGMGVNVDGRLGDGTTVERHSPVKVANGVVTVSAGWHHSLFLKSDGTLWAMGTNDSGQLGDGTSFERHSPVIVAGDVVAIAGGADHSLFLKRNQTLWAMGGNTTGQLGDGTTVSRLSPVTIARNVVGLAAGAHHSVYWTSAGKLWAAGDNTLGQLGDGTTQTKLNPVTVASDVISATAGLSHTLYLKKDGTAWAFGANAHGQLGIKTTTDTNSPTLIANFRFARLTSGSASYDTFGMAARPPQSTIMSQSTIPGQKVTLRISLNNGVGPFTFQWSTSNTNIIGATNSSLTIVSAQPSDAGDYTVVATDPFGASTTATATLTVINPPPIPLPVPPPFTGTNPPPVITSQPAGGTLAIGTSASLSVAVSGSGPFQYQWMKDETLLPGATNNTLNVTQLHLTNCGSYRVIVTNPSGMALSRPTGLSIDGIGLMGWGRDLTAQLGDGDGLLDSLSPKLITNNVFMAAAGSTHSLFVRNNGVLWAMGDNSNGRLGDGTTLPRHSPIPVASNVVAVAAGNAHSLYLGADGRLWSMGLNANGQLGDGTTLERHSPVAVASDVVAIAAGDSHSLYLTSDGVLWGMGKNDWGQLGNGLEVNNPNPIRLATNVVEMAAGDAHTLYITVDGNLWTLGQNIYGQLGDGTVLSRLVPIPIAANVIGAAAGAGHSLFLERDGSVWAMGYNADGRIGNGSVTQASLPVHFADNAVAVAAGNGHSLYLAGDGVVWTTGYNSDGELGDGTIVNRISPVSVPGVSISSLGGGGQGYHSLAVGMVSTVVQVANQRGLVGESAALNALVVAGNGPFTYQWQAGNTNLPGATNATLVIPNAALSDSGDYTVIVTDPFQFAAQATGTLTVVYPAPVLIAQPVGKAVAFGNPISMSVTASGRGPLRYQWIKDGTILVAQTNATLAIDTPRLTDFGSYRVSVSNPWGVVHSLPIQLNTPGEIFAGWGQNTYGQLGDGTTNDVHTVKSLGTHAVAVSVGVAHSLSLGSDGILWGVGDNSVGQLGNGSTNSQLSPIVIASNVVTMAAGYNNSLYVTSDGRLFTMGWNGYGQLGDGTEIDRWSPVSIASNVVAVAAGNTHSLFLKGDGSLWGMGDNRRGQLGTVAGTNEWSPSLVANDVTVMAAGQDHSMYISTDGRLWGIGGNYYGQLGDGTNTGRDTPASVASNVVAIATGYAHSVFLKQDGTVWATGYNAYGQLGDGTLYDRISPVKVAENAIALSTGADDSLLLKQDGNVWIWGRNTSGSLGDGTDVDRLSPIRVEGVAASSVAGGCNNYYVLAVGTLTPKVSLGSLAKHVGESVTLVPSITGADGITTYQWQHAGTILPGATNASLTLTNLATSDTGPYTIIVSSAFNVSIEATATLSVTYPAPIITQQPNGGSINYGDPFTLSVQVTGQGSLQYQWIKDGSILVDQTNATLTVPASQLTDAGIYRVVISNPIEVVSSRAVPVGIDGIRVAGWGLNGNGQLGDGGTSTALKPEIIATNIVATASGATHSLLLGNNGILWAMGSNLEGQLGDGTTTERHYPVAVASNVVSVACGAGFSLYLTLDQTLWAMGRNVNGQLGDGTATDKLTPIPVLTNVVAIAAGESHSLLLKSDGTVWTMGRNNFGQLGDGTLTDRLSPIPLASHVVAIAAGANFSMFITTDGSLWGVGGNDYGQLGNGTYVNQTTSIVVATNVAAVATGTGHSHFLSRDGTVLAVGYNADGRLGDGSITSTSVPVSIGYKAYSIGAANGNSLFLQRDGTISVCGYNQDGETGQGSGGNILVPTPISGYAASSLGVGSVNYHLLLPGIRVRQVSVDNQTVREGQPITLSATVTGDDAPYSYQWQAANTNIIGATNLSLVLTNVALSDAGEYTVIVRGTAPIPTTATGTLTVLPRLPVIATHPKSVAADWGQSLALSVVATGKGPFQYQWLKDDVLLVGQTNATLTLPALELTDFGSYRVAVTAPSGMALSRPALVSMLGLGLKGWGNNFYGQLGDGTTNVALLAEAIKNNVIASAAGTAHSLFVDDAGVLWSMGYNGDGRLGDGSTLDRHTPVSVASNVVAVAAGNGHSLYITSDGLLWAMGWNQFGQLGDGTTIDQHLPVNVASNVVAIAAGNAHSLFLQGDGTVGAVGSGYYGQLGDGLLNYRAAPVTLASNVVAIAAGEGHSMYLQSDGTLWGVGANQDGQLGYPYWYSSPARVMVASNVIGVAVGASHSLILKRDKTVWATGYNEDGRLGDGTMIGKYAPVNIGTNAIAIATGNAQSYYLAPGGVLWAAGYNGEGEIGDGTLITRTHPVAVPGIVASSLGRGSLNSHLLAIGVRTPRLPQSNLTSYAGETVGIFLDVTNLDGSYNYQWSVANTNITGATNSSLILTNVGLADSGEYTAAVSGPYGIYETLTATLTVAYPPPVIVNQPTGINAGFGEAASFSVKATGQGPLEYQWIKDGTILTDQTNAILSIGATQLTDYGTYRVAVRSPWGIALSFPTLLTLDGLGLKAWGQNNYGQFGDGTTSDSSIPKRITDNVVAAAAGDGTSFFVGNDSILRASGYNADGRLGDGTTVERHLPVTVASNVIAVATGNGHSLYITSDGVLWAMGVNYLGQLGDGTTTLRSSPLPVATNVVAVSAGAIHSLFLRSDGSLWSMGDNSYGQLGNGTMSPRSLPMKVAINVIAISAGATYSAYVTYDGSLWMMGANQYGQIGNGTTITQLQPVQVATNIISVAAGGGHTLMLHRDGTLWATGYNADGRLGDGTTIAKTTPVSIASNVIAIATGVGQSLYQTTDGTLWSSGYNPYGAVGDGTLINRSSPVAIPSTKASSLISGCYNFHTLVTGVLLPVATVQDELGFVGHPVVLTVSGFADEPSILGSWQYQWQLGGTNIVGATNSYYTIESTKPSDAGIYRVTANGPFGYSTTASAALTVRIGPPDLVQSPTGRVAKFSAPTTLSVVATGEGPLTYQWLKDGKILSGETNQNLTIPSFKVAHCGSYQVAVSSPYGMSLSTPALFTLPEVGIKGWGYNATGQLGDGTTNNQTTLEMLASNGALAAMGSTHSLYVTGNGTLWVSGGNAYGQLGDGTTVDRHSPVPVASNVVAVAAGFTHSLFIRDDGTLWAMGDNAYGQLGDGTSQDRNSPVLVANNVGSIAAGWNHSLFIKRDGTLWGWGYNGEGELGNGTTANQSRPIYIDTNVVAVAAGASHTLYLKSDGTVWGMGWTGDGELGTGKFRDGTVLSLRDVYANIISPAAQVWKNVTAIAAGGQHSFFLESDGKLWGTGDNTYEQLNQYYPPSVHDPFYLETNVVAVSAGLRHSSYVTGDGYLWTLGYDANDELGAGDNVPHNTAIRLPFFPAGLGVGPTASHELATGISGPQIEIARTAVYFGKTTTLQTISSGEGELRYQWSKNGVEINDATNSSYPISNPTAGDSATYSVTVTGVLGYSATASAAILVTDPAPVLDKSPVGGTVVQNSAASLSASASGVGPLRYQWIKDGVLIAGQTNDTIHFPSFQFTDSGNYQIAVSSPSGNAISLPTALTVDHLGLKDLGFNSSGELGDGTIETRTMPVSIADGVVASSAGLSHSMMLKSDGTLWATGANGYGQLGDGTQISRTKFELISSNVVTMAAGGYHSLFVKNDGTLWTMGDNEYGMLGDGTALSRATPVNVASNVVAVAAGKYHSLFLQADATLWSIGGNGQGQIGDGTVANHFRPFLVDSNVLTIAAGQFHTLYITTNGNLSAVGVLAGKGNWYSQRPSTIATNAIGAAGGSFHTILLQADGLLWGIGWGSYDQTAVDANGVYSGWLLITNHVKAASGEEFATYFLRDDGSVWSYGSIYPSSVQNGAAPPTQQVPLIRAASLASGNETTHVMVTGVTLPQPTVTSGIAYLQTPAQLTTTVAGDGPFSYQWQVGGTNLIGATNSVYAITNTSFSDAGTYTVVVTGVFGQTASASGVLTVTYPPPIVTQQPAGGTVGVGSSASLSVVASGEGPFAYRWMKDGVILNGATNATLSLSSFQVTDSGNYRAIVTTPYGVALTIPTPLAIDGLPLKAWGSDTYGELGDGSTADKSAPETVATGVVTASGGGGHSVFVKSDHTLWGMGYNADGRLGDGRSTSRSTPTFISSNVVDVAAGDGHTLFLSTDGKLWGTGENMHGQLGDGTTTSRVTPVLIATNVVAIAAGTQHSLFLKGDGKLWAMGWSGNPYPPESASLFSWLPVQVAEDVISMADAYNFSLCLKRDGTVWEIGNIYYAQLNGGTAYAQTSWVNVAEDIVGIAAGSAHSLFLRSDGTLLAIGYNYEGELGVGTVQYNASPVPMATNVVAIAAGLTHSMYLTGDGAVWATGGNDHGQQGNGTNVNQLTPHPIANLKGATLGLSESSMHSLVIGESPVSVTLSNVSVAVGNSVTLNPQIIGGDGPFTFQWIAGGTNITGATNSSFSIASASFSDAGKYLLRIQASLGQLLETPVELAVVYPDVNVTLDDLSVAVGESFTLKPIIVGGDKPFSFQWKAGGTNIVGATQDSYSIASANPADSGNYIVQLLSAHGQELTAQCRVFVYRPSSSLLAAPQGNVFKPGEPASLSVPPFAGRTITCQWLKDGAILSGQTNTTLSIDSFGLNDCGNYQAVVNFPGSMVVSLPIALTMKGVRLEGFGANTYGQLGIGNTLDQHSPKAIASDVVAAAEGGIHSLFLMADHTLWGMGSGALGQLGGIQSQNSPAKLADDVVAIAAGEAHSLVLKSDGVLWGMGFNGDGELGNGVTQNSDTMIPLQTNVVGMAAGYGHSLFLKSDGTLWAQGNNLYGQLGDGTTTQRITAVQVASNVVAMAAGWYHSAFLKNDGTLWVMGYNNLFQLGDGSFTDRHSPIKLADHVVAVAVGWFHTLFIKDDETLWGVGGNQYNEVAPWWYGGPPRPVVVSSNVVAVAGGYQHSLYVKDDHSLWDMGYNASGELGNGTRRDGHYPAQVHNLTAIGLGIGSQNQHSLALLSPLRAKLSDVTSIAGNSVTLTSEIVSGTGPFVYQWMTGQTNIASATNSTFSIPKAAIQDSGTYSVSILSGDGLTCLVSCELKVDPERPLITIQPKGTLVGFGSHATMAVTAVGSTPMHYQWMKDGVILAGKTNSFIEFPYVQFTDCGNYQVVVLTADAMTLSRSASLTIEGSRFLGWGNNSFGQLGDGTITAQFTPKIVGTNVTAAATGGGHTLYITSDGILMGMGRNNYGQLGDGTTIDRLSPIVVSSNVIAVAAGIDHSLFLKNDGSLWATGLNAHGELGDDTGKDQHAPVMITEDVAAISAGGQHSLLVKSDGTLLATGANDNGQLGDGTHYTSFAPIEVEHDVITATAGFSHSVILKADHNLYATGSGDFGQRADGQAGSSYGFKLSQTNVIAASAGQLQTFILKDDRILRSAGWDGNGQLGDGQNSAESVPVAVASNVTEATGGIADLSFLDVNGALWTAGWSTYNNTNDIIPPSWIDPAYPPLPSVFSNLVVSTLSQGSQSTHTFAIGSPVPSVTVNSDSVDLGQPATFLAAASGDGPLSYQWRAGGTNVAGATNASFTIASVARADAGEYSVEVTDSRPFAGIGIGTLKVADPNPGLITSPMGTAVVRGAAALLSVTAAGRGPMSYQWFKDGVALPDETSTTLIFDSFQFSNCGYYQVLVSNPYGKVLSDPTRMTIAAATPPPGQAVAGRYVFYNQSAWDGNNAGADFRDDNAMAVDKVALRRGEVATFANYTSYSRGINGVMIDLPLMGCPDVSDFSFKVGNDSTPGGWSNAPAPVSISIRTNAGVSGSDRVTLIWSNNVIQNEWLEVSVLATTNTGLSAPDIFYFGNAIGETGNSTNNAQVTVQDLLRVRSNYASLLGSAHLDNPYDFNRDEKVNVQDLLILRNNLSSIASALKLIDLRGLKLSSLGSTNGNYSAEVALENSSKRLPAMRMVPSVAASTIAPVSEAGSAATLHIWVNTDGTLSIHLSGISADAFHLEAADDLEKEPWRPVSEGRQQIGSEYRWRVPTNSIGAARYFRVVRDR